MKTLIPFKNLQKFFVCFLLLLGSFKAFSTEKLKPSVLEQDANGNWFYEKVVTIDSVSKKDIYDKLKSWVIANVKTVDNNIMFDDANFDRIVTTPTISIEDNTWTDNQTVNFKLTVSFKDGKMKIYAAGFTYRGHSGSGEVSGTFENYSNAKVEINVVNSKFDEAFTSFVKALKTAARNKKKDSDW